VRSCVPDIRLIWPLCVCTLYVVDLAVFLILKQLSKFTIDWLINCYFLPYVAGHIWIPIFLVVQMCEYGADGDLVAACRAWRELTSLEFGAFGQRGTWRLEWRSPLNQAATSSIRSVTAISRYWLLFARSYQQSYSLWLNIFVPWSWSPWIYVTLMTILILTN